MMSRNGEKSQRSRDTKRNETSSSLSPCGSKNRNDSQSGDIKGRSIFQSESNAT